MRIVCRDAGTGQAGGPGQRESRWRRAGRYDHWRVVGTGFVRLDIACSAVAMRCPVGAAQSARGDMNASPGGGAEGRPQLRRRHEHAELASLAGSAAYLALQAQFVRQVIDHRQADAAAGRVAIAA